MKISSSFLWIEFFDELIIGESCLEFFDGNLVVIGVVFPQRFCVAAVEVMSLPKGK